MPTGKGYGRTHQHKNSRQVGITKGGRAKKGKKRGETPATDKVYDMQMKDASSGKQRYFHRQDN